MFLSFYTFIIISIVKVTDSVDVNEYQRFEPFESRRAHGIKRNVKEIAANKRASGYYSDEAKLFENIKESPSAVRSVPSNCGKDDTLSDLKTVLQKLLVRLDNMDNHKDKKEVEPKVSSTVNPILTKQEPSKPALPPVDHNSEIKHQDPSRKTRWGRWTQWSSCSVTCGKGREIRWRHCIDDCEDAETEMEEKTCQLPACGPVKLFGIRL